MECVGSLQSQCTVDEGEEGAGGERRGQEGAGGGRRGQEGAGGGRRGQEGAGGGKGDSNNTPQASLQVVRITVLPPYQVNNAISAIRTPNNYINYI